MPVIQFRRTAPGSAGTLPATGSFRFVPTADRTIPGDPDVIVKAKPFTLPLVDGAVDVELAPTGIGWAWSVFESIDGIRDELYYVVVPDVPGPLDDTDLARVNPASLSPRATPTPAWWAAVNGTIATAAIVGDDLILTRHDGATVNAGAVRATPAELETAAAAALPAGAAYVFFDTDGRPYAG